MRSVCLAMIVRDEAHVIERCLASVQNYITHYVICDTGSTDATPRLAEQALEGIPGQVYHDRWVDFATNRNLSLERALASGADYVLVLDADETFALEEPYALNTLGEASYCLRTYNRAGSYVQERLLRADLPWQYAGVIHEYPEYPGHGEGVLLPYVRVDTKNDGARSLDPEKCARDNQTMRDALAADPFNARLWFHLAMGAGQLHDYAESERACEQVQALEGSTGYEVWYSGYMLAHIYQKTGRWWLVTEAFLHTYAELPQAAEPLYWLGRFHMDRAEYTQALPYLELASQKKVPPLLFLVEESVYAYEACCWLSKCLVALERPEDANAVLLDLITEGRLPADVLEVHTEQHLREMARARG